MQGETNVSRRDFLRRLLSTGIATTGTIVGALLLLDKRTGKEYFRQMLEKHAHRIPNFSVEVSASDVQMVVVRGSDVKRMIRAVFDVLGGARKFIRRDDVVLIKPNVAFDRPPALCATTNPETLKAVIEVCYEAGAKEVIVADNPINEPEGCFIKTGIKRASIEAGARIIYPKPHLFEMVEIGGVALKSWLAFYEPLRLATKVIGVAPIKDHNLSSASMCMKNWYGLLGGTRNRFHQRIHDVIADLANWMKPTLVILDGVRVLMSNGPTGGRLSDVAVKNTIIAGVDQVAVDAFGYTLLGRDPNELGYLQRAKERGIGNPNWGELNWKEVSV
jgi:uncharacterized protein (DUF362 family)